MMLDNIAGLVPRDRFVASASSRQMCFRAIRDFYDDTTYNHSTFGHLHADGLSFVDRQYPSPP